ncbi:MAG: glycosyltransferase family 2 protein [Phormidesmis sp.]
MIDSTLTPSLSLSTNPAVNGTLANSTPSTMLDLSVVVPIYNEVETIPHLVKQITDVLKNMNVSYELICVDDGSTDGSVPLLRGIAEERNDVQAVVLRRNYGQSAAMSAGFNQARGRVIVTLDGDLQNEPADIATVYERLLDGYDLVSGWRKERQDDAMTRLLPSKIANKLIAKVTGVRLHDYGCSLKAYRAEVAKDMHLYGELHRFLPALAYIEGARITEIPVRHHARQFGKSKYGLGRTLRVVMDLLTIYFMKTFLTRPMHVFGPFGIVSIALGSLFGLYLTFLKLFFNEAIGTRPLLMLAVLLIISGIQLFSFGLLAELGMRTYHESQKRPIYRIREIVG